ncbi:MAG TPA: hypothetical protein ENJ79_03585 [Gammaproteobacteria bacterium]|nr:hypothetical protein [Gammaproteobacteria bacterium]
MEILFADNISVRVRPDGLLPGRRASIADDGAGDARIEQTGTEYDRTDPAVAALRAFAAGFNQALGLEPGKGLDLVDLSADAPLEVVVGRMANLVSSLLEGESDVGARAELLQRARNALAEGFEEAAGLSGGGRNVIDARLMDIQAAGNRALDELVASPDAGAGAPTAAAPVGPLSVSPTPPAAAVTAPPAAGVQAGVQAAQYTASQSTSLVIDTRDGDTVTIDITRQVRLSQAEVAAQSPDAALQAAAVQQQASVSFSFNVAGTLDEEEREAVSELVGRIDAVSQRFFDGQVQAAFSRAAALEYDAEELAGFSLSLSSRETYQAVVAYQEAQSAAQPPVATGNASVQSTSPAATLQDTASVGGGLAGAMQQAAATTSLAQPERTVADIFATLTVQRAEAFGLDAMRDRATDFLGRLVESLVSRLGEARAADDEVNEKFESVEPAGEDEREN